MSNLSRSMPFSGSAPAGMERDHRVGVERTLGVGTSLPALLAVPEACRELGGLSRAQRYRLIAVGELETVHLGRLMRVTSRSLQAYIERLIEIERPHGTAGSQ